MCPSWKMMEFVNGKDYPIYEMENNTLVETTNYMGESHNHNYYPILETTNQ